MYKTNKIKGIVYGDYILIVSVVYCKTILHKAFQKLIRQIIHHPFVAALFRIIFCDITTSL